MVQIVLRFRRLDDERIWYNKSLIRIFFMVNATTFQCATEKNDQTVAHNLSRLRRSTIRSPRVLTITSMLPFSTQIPPLIHSNLVCLHSTRIVQHPLAQFAAVIFVSTTPLLPEEHSRSKDLAVPTYRPSRLSI
jgi:hypothetical protein